MYSLPVFAVRRVVFNFTQPFFLQALQNLYPQSEYDVFLKHDVDVEIFSKFNYLPETCFHFAGSYPETIRTPFFCC